MPREHARISVRIWIDRDWRTLPHSEQWAYKMLLSQKEINAAGVLPLMVGKWCKGSVDVTHERLWSWLRALEAKRYIVIDEDSEELLVRTFIRNDGVMKIPNMIKAARKAASAVDSARLRRALVEEFRRVPGAEAKKAVEELEAGLPDEDEPDADHPVDNLGDNTTDRRRPDDVGTTSTRGPDDVPTESERRTSSERRRDVQGEGEGVGEGSCPVDGQVEYSSLRSPRATARAQAAALNATARSQEAQRVVEAYAGRCRKRPPKPVFVELCRQVDGLLAEKWTAEQLAVVLDRWGAKDVHPKVLPSIAHGVANSPPNGAATAANGATGRRPSTTDERVAAVRSLRSHYEDGATS